MSDYVSRKTVVIAIIAIILGVLAVYVLWPSYGLSGLF
jgi:hypothetical protein